MRERSARCGRDFYCTLIEMAKQAKVNTLLDTDGEALAHGIEAGPTVVKPNQQEAERLLNRALITRSHFTDAVQRIRAMGAQSVLLSLRARGAVAADETESSKCCLRESMRCRPLERAMRWLRRLFGLAQSRKGVPDAARWAVAEGTASAGLPGMQMATSSRPRRPIGP